jgi:hypothetical protein
MIELINKKNLYSQIVIFLGMIHLASCSLAPFRSAQKQSAYSVHSKTECYSKDRIWSFYDINASKHKETTLAGFSNTSVQIANLIGIQLKIKKMIELPQSKKWLQLRQEVLEQVLLIQADIAVAIAELDCEKERTEILMGQLQRQDSDRSQNLSLVAIIVGAIGAVTTGGLSLAGLETASDIIAIVTGASVAGIGLVALEAVQEQNLIHSNNPLKEVWFGQSKADLLPPIVWSFLNSPIEQGTLLTRRENLIEEWKKFEWLGNSTDSQNHRIVLFFGKGGKYTLSELRDRAQLLDVLKDETSLAYRYVGLFLKDFLEFFS